MGDQRAESGWGVIAEFGVTDDATPAHNVKCFTAACERALEPEIGHDWNGSLDGNVAVYVLNPNPAGAIRMLAFNLLLSTSRFRPRVVGADFLFASEDCVRGARLFKSVSSHDARLRGFGQGS